MGYVRRGPHLPRVLRRGDSASEQHGSSAGAGRECSSDSAEVSWKFPALRTIATPVLGASVLMLVSVCAVFNQWASCDVNQPAIVAQFIIMKYILLTFGFGLVVLFIVSVCLVKAGRKAYLAVMLVVSFATLWVILFYCFNQYDTYPGPAGDTCPTGLPYWWPSFVPMPVTSNSTRSTCTAHHAICDSYSW